MITLPSSLSFRLHFTIPLHLQSLYSNPEASSAPCHRSMWPCGPARSDRAQHRTVNLSPCWPRHDCKSYMQSAWCPPFQTCVVYATLVPPSPPGSIMSPYWLKKFWWPYLQSTLHYWQRAPQLSHYILIVPDLQQKMVQIVADLWLCDMFSTSHSLMTWRGAHWHWACLCSN